MFLKYQLTAYTINWLENNIIHMIKNVYKLFRLVRHSYYKTTLYYFKN